MPECIGQSECCHSYYVGLTLASKLEVFLAGRRMPERHYTMQVWMHDYKWD